jgi:hypothetical protein
MAYLLLINEPRGQRETRSEDEGKALYQRMREFGAGLEARGLLLASESLRDDRSAVRIERRAGQLSYSDGPFAEAKEMVGGFYLLRCDDQAQAIAIAEECPAAEWASVEVREVAPCYLR